MNQTKTQMQTIRAVLRYIRRYLWLVAASILLAAVVVALTLYLPILQGDAIDFILDKGLVDLPSVLKIIRNMAIVILITAAAQWLQNICNNRVTYRVVQDLRNAAFKKIENLPLSYLDAHPTGDIVSRVIADADQFADGLLMGFTQLFSGVLTIVGTLGFMLSISVRITFLVVVLTPISLFVAKFIAEHSYRYFKEQTVTRGEQTALIDEMIGNQKVVQAYSQQQEILQRFDDVNQRLQTCSLKAVFFSSLTNPCTRCVNSLVYAGAGILGAVLTVLGHISVGQLSCILSYANQYTKPFNEISGVVTELQNAIACADRILQLIEMPAQTPDPANPITVEKFNGKVDIEHLNFSYVKDQKLIQDFCLHVTPGQKIAIVGPTGCGKTTLINLLMRFYDANSGKICVDNTNIYQMTRDNLRNGFGMVLQDTWIKEASVKENIAMGRPNATDEEIVAAAKAAHAHHFIKRVPNGYDTVLHSDSGLSQGQKQLLCIARVMLALPPMLILDEATSSIDTRTEMQIQNSFDVMSKGRTSFIVAHRLSTIRTADLILVMKDGNIIETGNHKQLMQKNGFYANLYNSQFVQS